jgi:hypothetical protein
MFCPKCGTDNPEEGGSFLDPSQDLVPAGSSSQKPRRSDSSLGRVSFMLAILSFIGSVVPIVAVVTTGIGIKSGILELILPLLIMLTPSLAAAALLVGVIELIRITFAHDRLEGKSFAIAGVVLSASWLMLLFILFRHPVKRPPPELRQKAQLHFLDAALELFASEVDGYPPSDALDPTGKPYCGAIKLCEAIMGQDLMGFHPDSHFKRDGTNDYNNPIYGPATLQARKGPFLQLENANAYQLKDIYKDDGLFDRNSYIICDTFTKQRHSGKRTGMPVLYYKANTSKTAHNLNNPDDPNNIYNYKDNYAILSLGIPEDPNKKHPLFTNPKIFYEMTKNYSITTQSRPCRADSYILISAGLDGLYGTKDDVANFQIQWKPK